MRGERAVVFCTILLLFIATLSAIQISPTDQLPSMHGDASGRVCGGPANTDSITILPPGPVTLPADQSRIFNATLYDSGGIPLGGSPDWSVSDGSIQPQGGSEAIYYPTSIGNHTVYACAAEVTSSVEVIVTMGATQSIDLVGNKVNLTTDEVVLLEVFEFDLHGNQGGMFVPSTGWTIPAGSNLHAVPGQPAVWTPSTIGNHTIEVSAAGYSAQWQVNVSRGMGTALIVDIDDSVITADQTATMTMSVSDQAGNLIPVAGNWSTLANQSSSWLTGNGNSATFNGTSPGNWTVRGSYSGVETGNVMLTDEVIITVGVGAISLVTIDGHDSTVYTGENLDLNPIATDLDGNIIESATFNWTLEGASDSSSIDEINHTFSPTTIGQHTIIADAGGKSASIRIQVEWSEPIDLNVTNSDGDWYLTVTTGETLELRVEGKDVMGEWHPYNPVWQVDEKFGTIEAATGTGDFLYHASSVNWTQLHLFASGIEYTILVYVTPGQLDHLLISVEERGMQGDESPMTIRGFDVSGNGVSIPNCDVTVTSSAGKARCDENGWMLKLENDGEQHVITAIYDDAEGSAFIDVQPILLGGALGSSTNVIAFAAGGIALLIVAVLLFSYQRVKRLAAEDDEEYEDDEEGGLTPVGSQTHHPQGNPSAAGGATALLAPPAPGATATDGLPSLPPHRPIPPPPGLFRQPLRKAAPAPPPPPFMFGTGIAPNSSSAHPVAGVFVRSEGRYGWGDKTQTEGSGYGWEAGVSGASAPPPHQPKWGDPGMTGAANPSIGISPPPPQPAPAPTPTPTPATAPAPAPTIQPAQANPQLAHPAANQAPAIGGAGHVNEIEPAPQAASPLGSALSLLSGPAPEEGEEIDEPEETQEVIDSTDSSETDEAATRAESEEDSQFAVIDEDDQTSDGDSDDDKSDEPEPSDASTGTEDVETDEADEESADHGKADSEPLESEPIDHTDSKLGEGVTWGEVDETSEQENVESNDELSPEKGDTSHIPDSPEEQTGDGVGRGDTQPDSDEWGDWGEAWGEEEGHSETPEEQESAPERGLGPCTEEGVVLKPLPGTQAGESGWYFDTDGKPSLWEFRPIGWERVK